MVYFSIAILVSSLIEKEYTAPTVAVGAIILSAVLPGVIAQLRPYSILRLMTGGHLSDKKTYLLQQPVPWAGVMASLVAAIFLVQAAIWLIDRREF